jgi:hypothetical protein
LAVRIKVVNYRRNADRAPAADKLNGSQTPERRRQKQTANSVSLKTNGSPLKTKGQRQWVS